MKALVFCIALAMLPVQAMAQQQNGPPPGYQDQGNGPPPGYQDRGNGPPPGYQDQDNGPPPGDEDQDDGPPPDDQGQGNGPPPGYQGRDNGRPPGYDDRQGGAPPPGYDNRRDNDPSGYRGQAQGQPGSADGKTPDTLGGWILVTSDANWQAKWETASNTAPTFTTVRDLDRGKKVFILTFVANPKLDAAGQANVTCDIELTRPDGSVSTHQSNAACLTGKIDGDGHATYLSGPVIGFVGDPGDKAGVWRIKVTLKDNNRHIDMPLEAAFNLKK